ncbi:MAG: hypothetical protein QG629_432 [Patescibacteria group bacterium]|nr:hypothetical protein [Candidatus Saccharibacteria bacterium]MDQ5963350.1 hypothetical protein [Patescibacteria group bacterium]
MGAFVTALLVAIGSGVWVYTKLAQRTGYGNEKNAYIGAGVVALIVLLVAFSILSIIM